MGFLFGVNGRFSRVEWWSASLLALTAASLTPMLTALAHDLPLQELLARAGSGTMPALRPEWLAGVAAAGLAAAWTLVAASAKRFRDRGKRGWWSLLLLVPLVGQAWLLLECGFGPSRAVPVPQDQRADAAAAEDGSGPPPHRLERALATSAAKQAHLARHGRRSYKA